MVLSSLAGHAHLHLSGATINVFLQTEFQDLEDSSHSAQRAFGNRGNAGGGAAILSETRREERRKEGKQRWRGAESGCGSVTT